MSGYEGKTFIDTTNLFGVERPDGFASNAEFVKSKTNGPTAKSFKLRAALRPARLGQSEALEHLDGR